MDEKCILCVDDEMQILSSLRRLLRKEPYRVLTANTGEEGLEKLRENEVQLIVSDQRMPQMTGIQFLQKAKELKPNAIRVILSGYADVGLIVESINKGEIYRFLSKPWNDEELKTIFRQCLEHYDMAMANIRLNEEAKQHADELEQLNEELVRLNRSLENLAAERTHSLQMSQEVLERMPVPVICISREGQIIFVNQASVSVFPQLLGVLPGTEVTDIFPGSLESSINEAMSGGALVPDIELSWLSQDCHAWIEPLGQGTECRGCVLGIKRFQQPPAEGWA